MWSSVADHNPHDAALVHGDRAVSWRGFDEHANGVAASLLSAGLRHQSKVALYMRNRPEYLESTFAAFKVGMVPVNTNYRYGLEELGYLWEDSEAEAVVFADEFTGHVGRLRNRMTSVRRWIHVGPTGSCPAWADPYHQIADSHPERTDATWGRSGDDLCLLYTGGTTGRPKGVMWRQDDLFRMLEQSGKPTLPEHPDPERFVRDRRGSGVICLPAAPLMHGTGFWFVAPILSRGGTVVTLTRPSLDPVELLDTVVERRVKGLCVAGEAFARPILDALEGEPGRWDISNLRVVVSAGAVLSRTSKLRLLRFATRAQIIDGLGSSESGTSARQITSRDVTAPTGTFRLSDQARVIDECGKDIEAGSGRSGRLAVGGHLPLGYFRDPEKTAETFVELAGKRYAVVGDWAEVTADGTIKLLGRGSSCINSGGEKIYPEEVEEALKTFPGIRDAGVVGLPDERFGEAVVGVVQIEPDRKVDGADLIAHVKARLAGYKAPKRIVFVEYFPRGPNGKIDHHALKGLAGAG